MSEDFEPSPRATKRRRTTRYSGQKDLLEDGSKDNSLVISSTPAAENGHVHVDSDTIEVHRSKDVQSVPSKKSTGRRAKKCTDNIDVALSSDAEGSPLIVNGSKTGASSVCEGRVGQKDIDVNHSAANEDCAEESSGEHAGQATRSSGRTRRPPKRLAESLDEQTPTKTPKDKSIKKGVEGSSSRRASPTPRGILTPSRKQKVRTQKSVAFSHEDREIEEQFGFRDIDTPAPKKLPQKPTPYPSRSLSLTKAREAGVVTIDEDEQHEAVPPTAEAVLVEDLLDVIPVPEISSAPVLPVQGKDEDPQILTLKRQVLSQLTSLSLPPAPPLHLDSQYKQLNSLLKATVASSESNSLLLLGPRGAGKTMLLDIALRDLEDEYPSEFHIVRLNGFLQTDDRLALREIWRQLGYSRNLEEAETEDIGASYADTMASLLSLLSHVDEIAIDEADDAVPSSTIGQRTSKSIVFILDEFDLFTTHPRQTLLYNLFDIAQSRKAPIVVVGCSSRMDVIECLEKRVKSRFSHRWLLVPSCRSLLEWEAEVKNALTIRLSEAELSSLDEGDAERVSDWNTLIESMFLPGKAVQHLIKKEFFTTKSLPQLFMTLYPLIVALQQDTLTARTNKDEGLWDKDNSSEVAKSPSVLIGLIGLPVLHMSLLISMCRLEAIHTLSTVNFNLVYTHYRELIDTSRLKQTAHGSVTHSGTLRKWSRELCREAWEELGTEGLIVSVIGGRDEDGNSGGAEMEETRMWRSEVGLEDMLWSVKEKFHMHNQRGGGAGEVLVRWCKEA